MEALTRSRVTVVRRQVAIPVLLAVSLLQAAPGAWVARGDDEEVVERFLARLGLVDLQALQLEQQLNALPAGAERLRVAERLADLYSNQLLVRSDDKAAYDQVLQRIQRLMERVPEARTASLEVMLLQADYFRAETLMTKWIADRSDQQSLTEARKILSAITPQLTQRQQQLHETVERRTAELDALPASDDVSVQMLELNRLRAVAGRAAFFAAWANYYFALSEPATSANTAAGFSQARDIFRRILGVESEYKDLNPAEWGLESIWRARTLIGLGLAEAASGNVAASLACFDLLDRSPAPADIREMSPYWRIQALLNAGRIEEAIAHAKPLIGSMSGAASQGRVSLCVSLVRAGFGGGISNGLLARELGMLGITGLIKLRQQSAVRQLLEKYRIPIDDQTGFHLAWLRGQQRLDEAEKSKREDDYAAAEQALAQALTAPDASEDLAGTSQCQYQQAWCLYKLGKLPEAAQKYESALEGLKATDAKTAIEAAWMAFVCYHSLSKDDRKHVQSAVNMLRAVQRDFPDHPYAKRAEYYAGKLQQAALPAAETLANLERVPESSPDYLSARYDICQLTYEQWSKADADKERLGTRLLAAVNVFLQAATSETDASRRVRSALIGADVALNGPAKDDDAAAKFLDLARRSSDDRTDSRLLAEYHYRALQLATRRDNESERRSHADWIVQHAEGSVFELPALVIVAKAIDDQVKGSGQVDRQILENGRQVYQRLVERFGDDAETLRNTKNAQVAVSRLAFYAEELGEHATAGRLLSQLLAAHPADAGYLRRAGLAAYRAGEFAAALENWRKLAVGLPDRSDEWFEAKYYQLASLAQVDRAKAREALAQFRLLFPQLGPPAWRGKFAELQQRVE